MIFVIINLNQKPIYSIYEMLSVTSISSYTPTEC